VLIITPGEMRRRGLVLSTRRTGLQNLGKVNILNLLHPQQVSSD
jgi:hypothetical protein